MADAWNQSVEHFRQYLPPGIDGWVVVTEAGAHAVLTALLRDRLPVVDVAVLGQTPPEQLSQIADGYASDDNIGLLEFVFAGAGIRYGGRYHGSLAKFARWPVNRCRLCPDVWDANFAELFAESPSDVGQRCRDLEARLRDVNTLTYRAVGDSDLEFSCQAAEWVVYSGTEDYDYTLPSGEVACLPRSVDGSADVAGWIIGTIPFGPKYGRIPAGSLGLTFRAGEITSVHGKRQDLCADVEMVLTTDPGLRGVAELGLGQSNAVRAARDLHPRGCIWHEKHLGLHLGLGAELAETSDVADRVTGNHIDIVFDAGTLSDSSGAPLLSW
jgi:hypothetical protein